MTEVCIILFNLSFYYTLTGFYLFIVFEKHPSVWGVPILVLSAGIYMVLKSYNLVAGRAGSAGSGADAAGGTAPAPGIGGDGLGGGVTARALTIVCCALPCTILLLRPSLWQIIHFIPAWAFYCFSIWSDRVYTDRSEFETRFGFTAKLLIIMILGFVVTRRLAEAVTGAIPYFIAYLLSGVCLMRILRDDGKVSSARNVAVMLILLVGSIGLTIAQAPKLVLSVIRFIYQNVIVRILMGIVYLFGAIVYGIVKFFSWLFSLFGAESAGYELEIEAAIDSLTGEEAEFIERVTPRWLEIAGMVLLAVAVAFVVFLIMRRLIGSRTKEGGARPYTEERELLKKRDIRLLGGLLRPSDPRQAVRWYYRKYLKEGVSKGAVFAKTDTSLSVLQKYSPFFAESGSGELRELYIKARYQNGRDMVKSDADSASRIWRELK